MPKFESKNEKASGPLIAWEKKNDSRYQMLEAFCLGEKERLKISDAWALILGDLFHTGCVIAGRISNDTIRVLDSAHMARGLQCDKFPKDSVNKHHPRSHDTHMNQRVRTHGLRKVLTPY